MATESASSWLDTMPTIPLARGVPVLTPAARVGGTSSRGVTHVDRGGGWWLISDIVLNMPEHTEAHESACLVALDDPQGFGYALRWYWSGEPTPDWDEPTDREHPMLRPTQRWIDGEDNTDADRLALARAIAEVVQ